MSRFKCCALLLLVAFLSPDLSPARNLAYPVHRSRYDHTFADSTESESDKSARSELPANVIVPAGLKSTLNSMLTRSPTFRRQCKMLNDAGNVRIDLKVVVPGPRLYKARSIVQRHEDGYIIIQMLFAAPGDYIEVIGHEFEHAVEQAEGLDLKTLAAARCCKVYEVATGVYETARAIQAGHLVAQEYYSRKHH
jgi:hypothetical protein